MNSGVVISDIHEISAIYYALLQCGYDYYSIEREQKHIAQIKRFVGCGSATDFFSYVKQNSCEVYPYWPRAFMLETACFFLRSGHTDFSNFENFQKCIMDTENISKSEKDDVFWKWIKNFPTAIHKVLSDKSFQHYLEWENYWLSVQNDKYRKQLQEINQFVDICIYRYHSPVTQLKIVLNPIKCVYAADYHIHQNCFVFSSGRFQLESVIHEFLHHVVHPFVLLQKDIILAHNMSNLDIDNSYYLSGDNIGKLNAFEEYAVRNLTEDILKGKYPDDISCYLCSIPESKIRNKTNA